MAEADAEFDLELGSWPSLEAQVAAVADDIAYDNHDIDDGIRAGLLQLDELVEVPIVRSHWDDVERRHPGLPPEKKLRALVRDQIGTMVGDLIAETLRRVKEAGVETCGHVRSAGQQLAGFSAELAEEERALKCFLYARLYNVAELVPVRMEAQRVVANLFAATASQMYHAPDAGLAAMAPSVVANVGGSQAHLNMQPFLTLSFCIALQGIFPSPN